MNARFCIFFAVVLGITSASANPEVDIESPAVTSVIELREQLQQHMVAGDAAAVATLISEEFVASDPSNTVRHRDDIVALVSSGRLQYDSLETTIDYARQLGDDLVVVMGTESSVQSAVPVEGRLQDVALSKALHRRFTDVFRKEAGQWRLLIKQSTIVSVE